MNYLPVIGLEVHIQSKTNSKMFCGCDSKYFGAEPNTHTCPVCLGLPGALPVINKAALSNCIKLALALNCEISKHTKFDRKNYYYPDLPKGYQISQYDMPIGKNGYFEVSGGETLDDKSRIRITRVHQEEDTAKSIHFQNNTAIDCNKAGVPLMEVVTEPDFENTAQVLEFAKKLQQLVRYINVSDANMEMGQMRFELNLSVKKAGETGYPPYKVECKNISSISVLEKVVDFEVARQIKMLEAGEIPVQETRGINDQTGETYSQRIKEDAEDYRYFPEPDLPNIEVSEKWIEECKSELGELPEVKLENLLKLEIPIEQALLITDRKLIVEWFEKVILHFEDLKVERNLGAKQSANFLVGEVFALLKKKGEEFKGDAISTLNFAKIIKKLLDNKISGSTVKLILAKYIDGEKLDVDEYVLKNDLEQISDEEVIKRAVEEVIQNSPKIVEDYKNGKIVAKSSLVGKVMGVFKGRANPQVIDKMLDLLLK